MIAEKYPYTVIETEEDYSCKYKHKGPPFIFFRLQDIIESFKPFVCLI